MRIRLWATVMVIGSGLACAGGDDGVGATSAATQAEAGKSQGLVFEVVVSQVWEVPSKEEGTAVPLAMKVTNTTDRAVQLGYGEAVHLRDAAGTELKLERDTDFDGFKSVVVEPGKSVLVKRGAHLVPDHSGGKYSLCGPDACQGTWYFSGLRPGKYALSMSFEETEESAKEVVKAFKPTKDPKDAPFFVGKVQTAEVAIEIAATRPGKPVGAASPEAAWKEVLRALKAGDSKALAKVTTEHGFRNLAGKGEKGIAGAEELRKTGESLAGLEMELVRGDDTSMAVQMGAVNRKHQVEFVQTPTGWKVDEWVPGE